jgi:hypothetical protein
MRFKGILKAGLSIAMAGGLTLALAGPASAATIDWNGVRGLDSITECGPDETPGLHWIFTKGGTSSVTSATLHIDGGSYAGYKNGNGDGAWHFDTPGDVDLSGGAYVDYTGTAGRNALLTISHGCTGEDTPPS